MDESLLLDPPWLPAVVFAVLFIMNWYIRHLRDRYVQRSESRIKVSRMSEEQKRRSEQRAPYTAPLIACVLLVCGYWQALPAAVFPLVVGGLVGGAAVGFLLHGLSNVVFYGMLSHPRWGELGQLKIPPLVSEAMSAAQLIGISVFTALCWLLTGSQVLLGTSLVLAFGGVVEGLTVLEQMHKAGSDPGGESSSDPGGETGLNPVPAKDEKLEY